MKATGQERFTNQTEGSHWVWLQHGLNPKVKRTLNGRVPARQNAIIKLQNKYQVWRFAHVILLTPMNRNLHVQGSEQMSVTGVPEQTIPCRHLQ